MVAGQDAETAGVLRQHLGDAELGREVADRLRQLLALLDLALVPARRGEVVVEVVVHIGEGAQELAIACQLLDAVGTDLAEHATWVTIAGAPQLGIDRLEQVQRLGMPRPAQVLDELDELVQLRGQSGAHGQAP